MSRGVQAVRHQLARQIAHWSMAVSGLSELDRLAADSGWRSLERYLGVALESVLRETVERLRRRISALSSALAAAESMSELDRVRTDLLAFRTSFMAAETVLDFYGDAVSTRGNERVGTYMRACDRLAQSSMSKVLLPLGKRPPPVLTYVDKGLGASILKAGLRLWDGRATSPVAAIKVVRHNLERPTALIHETGHQVAHEVGWNEELGRVLGRGLLRHGAELSQRWASWASEIAADAFAFGHTGFAAVAALHDVLAGDPEWVVRHVPGDPHPVSYLRVLLGHAMCARFYGKGPWDDLALAWTIQNPVGEADAETAELIKRSIPLLGDIVGLIFSTKLSAFGGQPLTALLDPGRVSPAALLTLLREAGEALYTSDHWIRREHLRLLALGGYLMAERPERAADVLGKQDAWMRRLGQLVALAG
ncbi:MAG: hypothetical protein U0441_39165 [Polyangiaceae bacterium]